MIALQTTPERDSSRPAAPLGVRFWDPISETFIRDGLLVTATSTDAYCLPRIGLPNPGNGYTFRSLPGLRNADSAGGDAAFWSYPPTEKEFLIRVTDTQDRYLPIAFRVLAPRPGWFSLPGSGDPGSTPLEALPLFPKASLRQRFDSLTARAQLWDAVRDQPAAWAILELEVHDTCNPRIARGLADADGHVLVAFGPPSPPPRLPVYPPIQRADTSSTSNHRISVRVFYDALVGGRIPPDLAEILNQPAATALARIEPGIPLSEFLCPNEDALILKTQDSDENRLLVLPARTRSSSTPYASTSLFTETCEF